MKMNHDERFYDAEDELQPMPCSETRDDEGMPLNAKEIQQLFDRLVENEDFSRIGHLFGKDAVTAARLMVSERNHAETAKRRRRSMPKEMIAGKGVEDPLPEQERHSRSKTAAKSSKPRTKAMEPKQRPGKWVPPTAASEKIDWSEPKHSIQREVRTPRQVFTFEEVQAHDETEGLPLLSHAEESISARDLAPMTSEQMTSVCLEREPPAGLFEDVTPLQVAPTLSVKSETKEGTASPRTPLLFHEVHQSQVSHQAHMLPMPASGTQQEADIQSAVHHSSVGLNSVSLMDSDHSREAPAGEPRFRSSFGGPRDRNPPDGFSSLPACYFLHDVLFV